MAPIRRYLRITKYSVLEVRIFLERPSEAGWLLSSRDPVLPRIIEEIRPKVLPKLREENETAKKKGGKKKKKGIKDVVSRDDFEVALFLTDSSSRHSLVTKQKQFASKPKIKSTGRKLTGWLSEGKEGIIDVDDDEPEILREESDDAPKLSEIAEADTSSRKRTAGDMSATDDYDGTLFVGSSDEESQPRQVRGANKRKKRLSVNDEDEEDEAQMDDKKKLAMNTSYDGFSIYGKILCLVVKRKDNKKTASNADNHTASRGDRHMMETWVSTQAAQEGVVEDE